MIKSYHGINKPYALVVCAPEDRAAAEPLLLKMAQEKQFRLCLSRSGTFSKKDIRRCCAAVIFLSENFARNRFLQKMLFSLQDNEKPVIPVRLDSAEQPEPVVRALMTTHQIDAVKYREDVIRSGKNTNDLHYHVMTNKDLQEPHLTGPQIAGIILLLGAILLLAAAVIGGSKFVADSGGIGPAKATLSEFIRSSTPTPAPTLTNTPEPTATFTASPTAAATATATPITPTATAAATNTLTPTATDTPTATATNTDTPTATPTNTDTPTPTATATLDPGHFGYTAEELGRISQAVIVENRLIDLSSNANISEYVREDFEANVPEDVFHLSNEDDRPYEILLNGTDKTPELNESDLYALSRMTKLSKLWIVGQKDSGLRYAANLPNLTNLYLFSSSTKDLELLQNAPKLNKLVIQNCGISDLSQIARFDKLTMLQLIDEPKLKDLSGFLRLSSHS